jgi:2,5-diketo-D-gluconate reductase A
MTPAPTLTLNDGTEIPQIGLGTWQLTGEEGYRVIREALSLGYRHLDTASAYGNEEIVGRAVRDAVAAGEVTRGELFITTKAWQDEQGAEATPDAFRRSLDRLGLDYVDLYLIHWPVPTRGHAVTAWRGLIEILGTPQCKSIGVSNFEIAHLNELLRETGVVPTVNQIELHPVHQRRELREFCAQHDIVVESWGPLSQGKTDLLERPQLQAMAAEHGKSVAQIVLRWHVQHGLVVIPKSSRPARLAENLAVFDFELSGEQMAEIDAMDEQRRLGLNPFTHE